MKRFEPIYTNASKLQQAWSNLDKFVLIWTNNSARVCKILQDISFDICQKENLMFYLCYLDSNIKVMNTSIAFSCSFVWEFKRLQNDSLKNVFSLYKLHSCSFAWEFSHPNWKCFSSYSLHRTPSCKCWSKSVCLSERKWVPGSW